MQVLVLYEGLRPWSEMMTDETLFYIEPVQAQVYAADCVMPSGAGTLPTNWSQQLPAMQHIDLFKSSLTGATAASAETAFHYQSKSSKSLVQILLLESMARHFAN